MRNKQHNSKYATIERNIKLKNLKDSCVVNEGKCVCPYKKKGISKFINNICIYCKGKRKIK